MGCRRGTLVALIALIALCVCFAAAAPAAEPTLDQALKDLPKFKFGENREHLTLIEHAVRDAKGPERDTLRATLAGLLGSNATPDAKRFVCRQLSIVGTAKEVPALATLLLDKELSDIARYALERIPDDAATDAMRGAIGKASPEQKIGIINSLGMRQDAKALGALAGLLKNKDVPTASAAAGALGRIGGPEAVKALTDARAGADDRLKPVIADAYLLCADRLLAEKKNADAAAIYQDMFKPTEAKHVRMAALRGIVAAGGDKTLPLLTEILTGTDAEMQAAALRFLREVSGPQTTKALVDLLPKLPAPTQAMLLDDLATRGDASALPAVVKAAAAEDEAVKKAAVKAMGRLGDASTLPMLTQLAAAAGPLADDARRSLDQLPAANVNDALLGLAQTGDTPVRKEAIRSLGARRAAKAVPALLKTAADADGGIRQESIKALEVLADEKSAPDLVKLVGQAKDDADRDAAGRALGALCARATDKGPCVKAILAAVGGADAKAKAALIRALSRAGGAEALAAVSGAVKDADAGVQDAAIRSLADWPDVAAAPQLLAIAKTASNATHQVLALRGYIRLAGLDGVAAADQLKMYAEAMAAAKRPDEKKQVLGGLGNVKTVEALQMVLPALDDKGLQNEAAAAAVKIAKNLGGHGKEVVRDAMQKVLDVSKDKNVRKEAEDLLNKAGGPKKAAAPDVDVRLYAAPRPAKAASDAGAVKMGWRLGTQVYSFNRFTFAEAVDKTASVGLKYVEIYPGQRLSKESDAKVDHGMSDADIATMVKMAKSKGITIVNYGVVGLSKNEAESRKVFEFAKKVGITTIVSEPGDDAFDTLDKLCEEYKINVALHNHPKPSPYWDPDKVLANTKGRSKRIGACADTGHWMRSGIDPLEAVKKLEGRIISFHFKDLNEMGGGHDVPWGTGKANVEAILTELKRQRFKGTFSIEYEHNWDNSVPEIAQCVEYFNATAAKLAK